MTRPLCCLALDVGNTTTRFALFASDATASDEPLGTWELTTPETITPDEARMHIAQVLGVLAQDVAKERQLTAEREARRDDATGEGTLGVEHLYVERRAQVDGDGGRTIALAQGDNVGDAVAAELGRVVVAHLEARLEAGTHREGTGLAGRGKRHAPGV